MRTRRFGISWLRKGYRSKLKRGIGWMLAGSQGRIWVPNQELPTSEPGKWAQPRREHNGRSSKSAEVCTKLLGTADIARDQTLP